VPKTSPPTLSLIMAYLGKQH